jgi:hypothetical protein
MSYLDSFKNQLRMDPSLKDDLVKELRAHLEDRCEEMRESGLTEQEAINEAAKLLGSPVMIGRQLYEVYSRGSWKQAFFAALPHLLIAMVYAINWRTSMFWVSVTILIVIGAVIYGWTHGKPNWLFPWLGYVLTPVVAVGVVLVYLPLQWGWMAAFAYIPVAVILLFALIKPVMKVDWLLVSLMLAPIPVVLCWGMVFNWWGLADHGDVGFMSQGMDATSPWVAASFIAIACAVAIFVRVRQRWLKVAVLLTPEVLIVTAVALYQTEALNIWGWFALVVVAVCSLLIPAFLDGILRKTLVARKLLRVPER